MVAAKGKGRKQGGNNEVDYFYTTAQDNKNWDPMYPINPV